MALQQVLPLFGFTIFLTISELRRHERGEILAGQIQEQSLGHSCSDMDNRAS